jgi:hypothetical protein
MINVYYEVIMKETCKFLWDFISSEIRKLSDKRGGGKNLLSIPWSTSLKCSCFLVEKGEAKECIRLKVCRDR